MSRRKLYRSKAVSDEPSANPCSKTLDRRGRFAIGWQAAQLFFCRLGSRLGRHYCPAHVQEGMLPVPHREGLISVHCADLIPVDAYPNLVMSILAVVSERH